MNKEKQIEEMAKVIHESDMNYNTTFPISMGKCLAKHGAMRTNAGIALYNAGYRKQSEWISVDERLPEIPGEYIVAVDTDEGLVSSTRFFVDRFIGKVTHWMPLPEPPKGAHHD